MTDYLKRWPAPKTLTNPGDEIKGTLIAWDAYSEKYPVMHIQTADGLVRIVRVTQVRLHERLADLNPNLGDRIWIRYDGPAPKAAPGMTPTKEFTVEVRRPKDPGPGDGPDKGIRGSASDNASGARK